MFGKRSLAYSRRKLAFGYLIGFRRLTLLQAELSEDMSRLVIYNHVMSADGFSWLHLQCEIFDERWEWIGNRWLERYQVTHENVLRHRCDNDVTPATNS